jgi:EmrB/QacA subfamily drug resistance transporter
VVFVTIAIGTFVSVLDQTSVNLALPRIAGHFDSTIPSVQWVALGYILVTGSLLMPMGRLADIMSRRKVYAIGFAIFTIAATLTGLSNSLGSVILFKTLQGVGAAMVQGTGMAIVTSAFPDEERGKVIGLFMTVVGLGAIAGPIVGGEMVNVFGWRAVFFMGVPFGFLSVIAALVILKNDSEGQSGRQGKKLQFDWMGAAFSSLALVVFLLVMTNGSRVGWNPVFIIPGFGLVVALVGIFIWWEKKTPDPMLALELFQRRLFTFGSVASFLSFFAGTSVFFLMPFYLQDVLGYSPGASGRILVPTAICFATIGPIAGKLSDRFGWRRFTIAGLILSATALFILSRLNENPPLPLVVTALILHGVGMGTFFSPNASAILSTVERYRYGIGTAYLNMLRNIANVTGVGVVTTIVTIAMASRGFEPSLDAVASGVGGEEVKLAFVTGLRAVYLTMFGACLIALAFTLFKGQPVSRNSPVASPNTAAPVEGDGD